MTNGVSIIRLPELVHKRLLQNLSVISVLSRSRSSENSSRKPFHMLYDLAMVRALYKKLVTLYPREFRERLSDSIEQTFTDLCNEKRQDKSGLFSFVLWTFIETAIGIFREHLLLICSGHIMQTILKTTGSSALISFLLILPFMIMEIVNRRNFNEDFPFVLFFALWSNLFAVSLIL